MYRLISTEKHRQLPFIAVVIYFLDEKFQLGFIPLKTDYFANPHTDDAIFEEIRKTLRGFNLDETLLFAAVSDTASNMVRGFKDLVHMQCVDHRMHRALTFEFYETDSGKKLLGIRKQLMKIYRHLIYKKTIIAEIAKEKSQDDYIEALRRAKVVENVSFLPHTKLVRNLLEAL